MKTIEESGKKWKTVIEPKESPLHLHCKELWNYRDLCRTLVRKNYATMYKQTIFSPLYFILGPILTSGVFSLIFGTVAGISTDGTPQFLFYLAGNLLWNFFAGCMNDNRGVFANNAFIMGKVYFPRLIIPISNVVTKWIRLLFDLLIFIVLTGIYFVTKGGIWPNAWVLFVPVCFLQLTLFGTGIGLIISSLTVKYRDLGVIIGFAMRIWMYLSPVIFPISSLSGSLRTIALLNPVAPVIEIFRYAFFGRGVVELGFWAISFVVTMIVFFIGLILFNLIEKDFIDTI